MHFSLQEDAQASRLRSKISGYLEEVPGSVWVSLGAKSTWLKLWLKFSLRSWKPVASCGIRPIGSKPCRSWSRVWLASGTKFNVQQRTTIGVVPSILLFTLCGDDEGGVTSAKTAEEMGRFWRNSDGSAVKWESDQIFRESDQSWWVPLLGAQGWLLLVWLGHCPELIEASHFFLQWTASRAKTLESLEIPWVCRFTVDVARPGRCKTWLKRWSHVPLARKLIKLWHALLLFPRIYNQGLSLKGSLSQQRLLFAENDTCRELYRYRLPPTINWF